MPTAFGFAFGTAVRSSDGTPALHTITGIAAIAAAIIRCLNIYCASWNLLEGLGGANVDSPRDAWMSATLIVDCRLSNDAAVVASMARPRVREIRPANRRPRD